jgi:pyruvate dehydrogenase E1 component
LRLSTRPLSQPKRDMTPDLSAAIRKGAYWRQKPAGKKSPVIAYAGAIAPEAEAAAAAIKGAGLLAITSADRLFAEWRTYGSDAWIAQLLGEAPKGEPLVTVLDGHPAALAWLGSVDGRRVEPLGVDAFGQCGDLPTLYERYRISTDAITKAAT